MQASGSQLGFIVENIDCNKATPEDIEKIKAALWEHGTICLKNQNLDAGQQVEFAQKFGSIIVRPPYYAPDFREPGHPAIIRVGNVGVGGVPLQKPQDAELWHKDGSFEQPGKNFLLSFLHPKIITQIGGQTGFVDCEDTYNKLPSEIKEQLEGATVLETSKTNSFFNNIMEEQHFEDSHHKIFQIHPISKRPIHFLTHRNYEITLKNGEKVDSTPFVDEFEKYYNIYSHKWSPGDLVIWDNYRVIHKSMGGYGNSQRLFFRVQCRVEPPY
ncbi:taurine catabolism dioxygenase, TauD/TfdA family protein (macronuclear) [Tetrahymena thermophila SB210]|uniref:Taurine catabolism dioxygenase, TauD/TfdA family protein n=1 Tax=Tetrahymena thermophila (strain SB210) TaxID=312017 RepID=I7M7K1_TETTS|nr:taurine catabolism dioxygenase, TauD/TfdA family protein [Tetrahymena thermophila SB210]EAR93883.2 taurine catabolism dioxygenase, TauD/TfdA family protein [Tetrahymena thermophila SB210]|eukprot:XP_001014128.2 taurine catabolism dioxygenase, TauD/TfdA family protein [Tetrahymena thermophila SB210]